MVPRAQSTVREGFDRARLPSQKRTSRRGVRRRHIVRRDQGGVMLQEVRSCSRMSTTCLPKTWGVLAFPAAADRATGGEEHGTLGAIEAWRSARQQATCDCARITATTKTLSA
jgi:hypothetical protein